MPRYNLGAIERRLRKLEALQGSLSEWAGRVEGLSAENRFKRQSLLATLDGIPRMVDEFSKSLAAVNQEMAGSNEFLFELERRLVAMEERLAAAPALSEVPEPAKARAVPRRYADPLELPPDLAATAEKLSAGGLAQEDFRDFLQTAIDARLLRFESPESVPAALLPKLERFFNLYRAQIDVISYEERLLVQELVFEAAEAGNYVELDQSRSDELRNIKAGAGALHVENIEALGAYRVFRFPAEDHPELGEFVDRREIAKRRLVWDLHALASGESGSGLLNER